MFAKHQGKPQNITIPVKVKSDLQLVYVYLFIILHSIDDKIEEP